MVSLVLGVQKPPCRVGKRFRDRLVVALEEKLKKPAGLKWTAWVRTQLRSAAATWAARRGVRGRASLEAADYDHLVPDPTLMVKERGPRCRTA
jgi:hypothetical protein